MLRCRFAIIVLPTSRMLRPLTEGRRTHGQREARKREWEFTKGRNIRPHSQKEERGNGSSLKIGTSEHTVERKKEGITEFTKGRDIRTHSRKEERRNKSLRKVGT